MYLHSPSNDIFENNISAHLSPEFIYIFYHKKTACTICICKYCILRHIRQLPCDCRFILCDCYCNQNVLPNAKNSTILNLFQYSGFFIKIQLIQFDRLITITFISQRHWLRLRYSLHRRECLCRSDNSTSHRSVQHKAVQSPPDVHFS
mgnify:CR=1 FL=1